MVHISVIESCFSVIMYWYSCLSLFKSSAPPVNFVDPYTWNELLFNYQILPNLSYVHSLGGKCYNLSFPCRGSRQSFLCTLLDTSRQQQSLCWMWPRGNTAGSRSRPWTRHGDPFKSCTCLRTSFYPSEKSADSTQVWFYLKIPH